MKEGKSFETGINEYMQQQTVATHCLEQTTGSIMNLFKEHYKVKPYLHSATYIPILQCQDS
jgi:hypothetical protein